MTRLTSPAEQSTAQKMVRDASQPMYQQLSDRLLGEIISRGLPPGHRLPGEHGMCELYGVSRTVVRQALAQLEQRGAIERVKGKGTFVAASKVAESLAHTLRGLYADVEARGGQVRSQVRRQEMTSASEVVAAALRLEPGSPVLAIERLRYVEDSPWSLTTTYLPDHIAPLVLDADLRRQSLYALLAENGIHADHGTRSVEAVSASREQAAALGCTAGSALMLLRSIIFDSADLPLEFFVAHHRGDQSRFEFRIDAGQGLHARAGFHRVSAGI